MPLFLIIFAVVALVGGYGIQKRSRWAWYGGWIFGFFAAGVVCYYGFPMLFGGEGISEVLSGCVFLSGGCALWLFWALYWIRVRGEFGTRRTKDKDGATRLGQ